MKLLKVICWSFVTLSFLTLMSALAWGASVPVCEKTGSFVVSIMTTETGMTLCDSIDHTGKMFGCKERIVDVTIKEINGVAVIPFGSEYKLSLKNNNGRRAVVKITIDGTNISSFGNLVIPANDEVTLERFITQSLSEGKKFKFVPLDHPKVDDPGRKENGLIRIEFQLEDKPNYIIIDGSLFYGELYPLLSSNHIFTSGNSVSNLTTSAEPGATIGGSKSEQKFHKIELDFEDKIWVVEIQLKGIKP